MYYTANKYIYSDTINMYRANEVLDLIKEAMKDERHGRIKYIFSILSR